MAAVPFVMERKVQYHGIWNTGLQLTDQFIKTIAEEFDTKPACPTLISMSSSSLSLLVFSRDGSRQLRKDVVAFDALREIAVNSFSPKCLMILYVNSKSKYSVIVCSCEDNKEAVSISLAYKQLKNIRMINEQKKHNWILRKNSYERAHTENIVVQNGIDHTDSKDIGSQEEDEKEEDSISTRSRTESGVMNDTFAFLNSEDYAQADGEDVFKRSDSIEREPATDNGSTMYNVGIQVAIETKREKLVSWHSSTSSLKSLKDELSAIDNGTEPNGNDAPTSDVSQEEFFQATVTAEVEEDGEQNGLVSDQNDNDHMATNTQKMVKTDDPETYHYRSVATMATIPGGRRYKKRPGSTGSSNMYKALAAQRKNGSAPTNTPGMDVPQQPSVPQPSPVPANLIRARPASFHGGNGVSYQSLFLPRHVHVSSTSVSRPIEDVYHSLRKKHVSSRNGRRKIVQARHYNGGLPTQ